MPLTNKIKRPQFDELSHANVTKYRFDKVQMAVATYYWITPLAIFLKGVPKYD